MARNKNARHSAPLRQAEEPGRGAAAPDKTPRPIRRDAPAEKGRADAARPAPADAAAAGSRETSGASAILADIRQRQKMRRVRGTVVLVVALALVFAWISGLVSSSISAASDLMDTLKITMMPAEGYPAQTGVTDLYQLQEMAGGYLELGEESCVLYTREGTRLRNIQAGYARPAVSAGSTRFVLYNRGGTELRVESRTRTLYTQTMGGSILLASMANSGTLAVAAENANYLAKLTIYSAGMAEQMNWGMTEKEGVPIRMSFSSDSRKVAIATLSASGGQLTSNLYLLDIAGKSEKLLATTTDTSPIALEWVDGSTLFVLYGDHAALLRTKDGSEKARYDFGGENLVDYARSGGSTALLLTSGTAEQLVLLDEKMTPEASTSVVAANHVTLTGTAAYTCTDTSVECYDLTGEYLWKRDYASRPQAVLESKQLLVFTGGRIEVCTPPAADPAA